MTIRTREQLTQDFETLATDTTHVDFMASERIRDHLAAIPEALKRPLTTDEMPRCYCPGDCEMAPDDEVCPIVTRVLGDALHVLLKRIGVE